METLVALFSQRTKLVFKISFTVLLLLKVFFYPLCNWFPGLMVLLYCFGRPLCFISIIIVVVIQIRRRKIEKWILCVFLLLLPLTDIYESLRFYCLRPNMEKAAVEIAQEYQSAKLDSRGILDVALPQPQSALSRNVPVTLSVDDSRKIKVSFQYEGLPFTKDLEYTYQTEVPYFGESTYNAYYPFPDYILEEKEVYSRWEKAVTLCTLAI